MCDPIIGAALAIGSGIMNYQQAENQEKAAKARNATLRANADAAYARDMAILDRRQQEEQEKTGKELFEARIEAVENRAAKQVRLGEAGITGLSVDAILGDTDRQAGRASQTLQRNFTSSIAALNDDRTKAYATLRNRYAQQEYTQGGSIFGTLLEVGTNLYAIDGLSSAFSNLSIPSVGNSFGMGRSAMTTSPVMGNLRPSNFGTPGMNFGGGNLVMGI